MPRTKPKIASNDLAAVNLSIAKARLAKLESDLPPPPTPEYTLRVQLVVATHTIN